MKRTHRKILFAVLAALLLTAGCGDGDDVDTPPTVEYKVMGGRLVWCSGGAEDMVVPGNASSIGNNAFGNCGTIGTLTIPKSVTHIMRYTFSGVKVGKIFFGGTVGEWVAMAEQDGFGETLRGTPVICSDGEWRWTAPAVPVKPNDWQITDGVLIKYSGNAADVTIPDGVTAIGDGAFAGCASLTHVTIPSGVTEIRADAFKDCTSLAGVMIPDSVTTIGENAFSGCADLTNIDIPASVETVGAGAIPAETSVTYHGTAEQWDGLAADGGLNDITVFITDENGTLTGYRGNAADITVPDGVKGIAGGAFAEHDEIKHIVIPAGVTDIASGAFAGCAGLTSIDIPASVTDIGAGALPAGTAVTYHGTAEQWDELAKDGGLDGVTVQFTGETGTPAHTHTWGEAYTNGGEDGHYRTCTDCGAHSATVLHECEYKDNADDTHTEICSVCNAKFTTESHTYGTCTANADGTHTETCSVCSAKKTEEHKYGNGTDIGNGTHSMTCKTCGYSETEDHGYAYTRTDAVYHSGVCTGCNARVEGERHTYSGNACGSCASPKPVLEGGTIDDNGKLTKYDGAATALEIPGGVTGIGANAFKGCTSLTSVTIPDSVESIGSSAFYGCTSLTTVTILDGVKTIAIEVFSGCTNLTSVTIPVTVTIIGKSAFSLCNKLKTVNYGGTEEQWEAIRKVSGYGLKGKTITGSDGSTWTAG